MMHRLFYLVLAITPYQQLIAAEPAAAWWPEAVEKALVKAKENRAELEKALTQVPVEQRKGMAFLIANMPDSDLKHIKADYLLSNTNLSYKARKEIAWGKDIPEEIFLNNVLPYANVDEKRDEWRQKFYDMCLPIVKECKTPSEAALKLNQVLFKDLNLKYASDRGHPNQSPSESIDTGKASCTGLSIVLSDACRSVCVPARLVGTPNWWNKRGNHTWVEIWDKDWHFTGACEPDPKGLDRGWFVDDASKAQKDSEEHAIYASSFQKTDLHFPLVWARKNKDIPAENVTDRYAKKAPAKAETVHVLVRVIDQGKKRVAIPVTVMEKAEGAKALMGTSRGETADLNDILSFDLTPGREYTITAGKLERKIKTGAAGEQLTIEILIDSK